MLRQRVFGFAAAALFLVCMGARGQSPTGIFEDHNDVGSVLHPGAAGYDAASKSYAVTGSGENMWFAKDEFHFVWKRVSGDFTFTADIEFSEAGGNAHKKAVLMARQSLATDSAYADVAVHGDGLTSLQAREQTGDATHEVGINAAHPRSVRLERRGDDFYMSIAGPNQDLKFAGGSMRAPLKSPFYVGIGVCSHDKEAITKAVFSNVVFTSAAAKPGDAQRYSTLETISVASTDRRVVRVDNEPREGAPAALEAGAESYPSSDEFVNCFPRVSPDGHQVAVLSYEHGTVGCPDGRDVLLRVISTADKKTKVLAKLAGGKGTLGASPWSPDGKSLTFVSRQAIPR
jgi:TolB protein